MTVPDYAALVEMLSNFADELDNDAEDARAAEAEEAQANAEEWAAVQRTSAAAITALVRERDEALARAEEYRVETHVIFTRERRNARAAALEEAAKVNEEALLSAWLAGFNASGEGWNGEYPEGAADKAYTQERARDYVSRALAKD